VYKAFSIRRIQELSYIDSYLATLLMSLLFLPDSAQSMTLLQDA